MIIGVGHKMRQGKTVIADYLVENYGYEKFSFAGALKEEIGDEEKILISYNDQSGKISMWNNEFALFEMYRDTEYKELYEKVVGYMMWHHDFYVGEGFDTFFKFGSPKKDRELLQLWGTDYRRNIFGDRYWIDIIEEKISGLGRVVIDDMRFKNEADYINQRNDGITIRVFGRDVEDSIYHHHGSEIDLDGYKYYGYNINNDGTLSDLYGRVDSIMCELGEDKINNG